MLRSLSLLAGLLATFALAQDTVVKETTGEFAVAQTAKVPLPERLQAAYDGALKQALRAAVEQAAGVMIDSTSMTRNSALVVDRVSANASGYVKSYEVLSDSRKTTPVNETLVRVKVKAVISTATLDKDMKAAQAIVGRLHQAKLLVVLQEQLMDDKGIATKSEFISTALRKKFSEANFTIINEKATGEGALTVASGAAQGKLDAKEVARKTDADFIVYGNATTRYLPPQPYQVIPELNAKGEQILFYVAGDYDLSMFETKTGRELGRVAGRLKPTSMKNDVSKAGLSYGQSASLAAENTASEIVSAVFAAIFEDLRNQDVNGSPVSMVVNGIDFDAAEDFEQALNAVSGVKSVRSSDFADGKANYNVVFMGNASDFGKALKGASFKKRKIVVTTVKSNLVEVTVAK